MNGKSAYIWGLSSRFIPQLIYLLTTIILARFLSPSDFGKMGVLAVIFTVANILIDSGLGGSLVKEKEITKKDCSTISLFNIVVGGLIYIILFFSSNQIERFFEIKDLSSVVRVVSIVFPITALGVVPVSILKRNLEFNCIFKSSLISVIVASLVSIVLAIKGAGVYALVAYQIFVNLVMVIFNYIYSRYCLSIDFSYSSLKKLIPFGFYTSIVTIIDTIYENLITILTGKFLNVQAAGCMYQAKRLEETISSSFATAIGIVAFPVLTKKKSDKVLFISECKKTFNVITLLVFPILLSVSLFSNFIIQILLGDQWIKSAFFLRVLVFAGVFIIMEQLILSFIKAWGRVKKMMYWSFVKRSIAILLLLITIYIDANYLVYMYLITTIVGFFFNYFLFVSLLQQPLFDFLKDIFINIVPSVLYYLLGYLIVSEFEKIGFTIIIIACFLSLYYLVYLKKRGLDILGFLKSKTRKFI